MIKKLFTSILLLGACLVTQAQTNPVTITYSNGTATVNYDSSVGKVTYSFVKNAISECSGFAGMTADEIKENVTNVVLTGDWTNYHLKKDQNILVTLFEDFGAQSNPIGLNLTACEGFESKFVSVEEEYDPNGGTVGDGSVTFTSLPEPKDGSSTTETKEIEVTVEDQFNPVTVVHNLARKGTSGQATIDGNTFTFALPTDYEVGVEYPVTATPSWGQTGEVVVYNGEKWVYIIKDWGNKQGDVTIVETYTYEDENEDSKTQANTDGLTQEGDDWYYVRYVYYKDANQTDNKVVATNTNELTLKEDGTWGYKTGTIYTWTDENGDEQTTDQYDTSRLTQKDGKWYYEYTVTTVTDPVIKFSFDGYNTYFSSIEFPNSDNFTFIPDELFKAGSKLQTAVLPETIVAIGNHAFASATSLEEVNFPSSLAEIGGGAFEYTKIKGADLSNTSITSLRYCTFMKNSSFEYCYYPTTLERIWYNVFMETGLKEVDLSNCHELTLISKQAYENCDALESVKVCSHPKTIMGGHGSGAFNNCDYIETVEVVACDDVTDITKCVCEAGAFDWNITNGHTNDSNVENYARLIFPRSAAVSEESEYNSAFDFFVGDYKAGVPINQNNLQKYWTTVPYENESGTAEVDGETVGAQHYWYNGWLEFINTGDGVVIPKGAEFLRTYSRTEGSGAVLLPSSITAYRVIDYMSTKKGYVADKKGDYVLTNPDAAENDKVYKLIDELTDEDKELYKNNPTYSNLTIGGQVLLKPLYTTNKNDASKTFSYVPENTGVVLYSTNIAEDEFLIFDAWEGDEYEFKEYPNTGDAYGTGENPGDVNMLVGSYGSDCPVGPVYPWYWDRKNPVPAFEDREYRNFGFNKSLKKWRRLQPGLLRLNRAYVQIPIARFDNFDENADQMPDFILEDHVVDNSANTMVLLDTSFGDDVVDGIQTINTNLQFSEAEAWFTLQGVKVVKPVKGGVYIHNNKKVVVK